MKSDDGVLTLDVIKEVMDRIFNQHEHDYINIAYGFWECRYCPKSFIKLPEDDYKALIHDIRFLFPGALDG